MNESEKKWLNVQEIDVDTANALDFAKGNVLCNSAI